MAKKNPQRVAILQTHIGHNLMIGSDPSVQEVRSFVKEHNRRYHAGEPGGPSGIPAYLIQSAYFFEEQHPEGYDFEEGSEIDLSGVL